jgi:putative peptidoglycan lipid II flippase
MQRKNLIQILSLSLSTLGSRILGLIRDSVLFSSLGNSLYSSAFIMAFTIPNLFRRLLGEGALTSAFVPIFTQAHLEDRKQAFHILNQTLSRMTLLFGKILFFGFIGITLLWLFLPFPLSWMTAIPMIQVLLPYAALICIAAILTAALNSVGKFLLSSFSPVILNLSMIAALALGTFHWKLGPHAMAYLLCAGVLIGGVGQLLLPAAQLWRHGWRPKWDLNSSDPLQHMKGLFMTATAGAAIVQLNTLITRIIAYQVSDEAVSQLYLASRLTELPLGVFSVAIYTVLFPALSQLSSLEKTDAFQKTCRQGLLLTLAVTLPAATGLCWLAEPILSLLFQWGRFDAQAVASTTPVLQLYAWSVPLHATIAFLTRVLHAKQDMRSPLIVSQWAIGVNIALSIALMIPFGAAGMASAGVLTASFQTVALAKLMRKNPESMRFIGLRKPILLMLLGCAVLSLGLLALHLLMPFEAATFDRMHTLKRTLAAISGGALLYLISVWASGLFRCCRELRAPAPFKGNPAPLKEDASPSNEGIKPGDHPSRGMPPRGR